MTIARRMRRCVGGMVPIWFPESMSGRQMQDYLGRTLADAELFIDPSRLLLVVDGCPQAEEPTRRAAAEMGERAGFEPRMIVREENGGKGAAVCTGLRRLLEDDDVEALSIRDADGDHDIYDLPQLYRHFETVREHSESDRIFVVGGRFSLTRPLGLARGELERVLNRVTVDAVNAKLAPEGAAVDERFTARYGEPADFQSGYKLYSREAAEVVIEALEKADAGMPEHRVMHWAVEFIPTVELLLRGFIPAALHRVTWDGQPQTTFDGSNIARAYSKQIAWLFERLDLPAGVAMTLLDRALAECEYITADGGADEIATLRRQVVERCYPDRSSLPPPGRGEIFI